MRLEPHRLVFVDETATTTKMTRLRGRARRHRRLSEKAKAVVEERGARFLFLPPYSPDLNPIEMAFAKLKAHLRRIGARTIDALWRAVGDICALYTPDECRNYLIAAGYASD